MNIDGNNVSPSENITRYILETGGFARTVGRVKPNVFLPAPNGQTSVYRITSLTLDEIWNIGQKYVADERIKTLYGRGDIITSHILNIGLKVEPDTEKHFRHANITGWPDQKSEKKLIATKLAQKAQLHLK